ncbi:hypothetical protein ACFVWR_03580 [Leifsonia sp. NPDC058292]|uniref:hypothetical protein n=1 Tax=Leifsonia sp. NPDC058292 TaxID=3346428 RepID=UPI0036DDE211
MKRRVVFLPALAIVSLVAGLLGVFSTTASQPAAAAAVGSQFDAGNIISDALFFNGSAMSASDVQATLSAKVPSCRAGYTCLKDYRQTTATRAAVAGRCDTYTGAANELASTIIAKVGAVCGISQKAIIVLLEKEQSLVTDTYPGSGQYRSATGYGCPDTAACDSQYYGFFNQVYNAALQFKRYAASPTSWNHVAGRVNAIRYSPNASCGSSNVYIQNQATAGLYNYTPYQPNAAALANLYGTGDGCSAYGNRNFWRIYTDWFGSTTAATSLLRTTGNATVYIVSGANKYPVTSQGMLNTFAPLGQVGYVSQSYLDGYATMQPAGRVLRSPNGTIYFTDASIKLPFGSCGLVVDYGGKCDTSGFVQLTDDQLSGFANGPAMGPILGTTTGSRYYVTSGTKREILDNTSQAAAGLPSGFNVLTEDAVSALPYAAPIVRDAVFATQRGTSNYSYLGNRAAYPVDAGALAGAGLPGSSVGSLSANSIAIIPKGSAFTGIVQVPGSATKYVLADGGSYVWNTGSTAALPAVSVPQGFLTAYPSKGTIVAGSMIKTPTSATVYIVMADKLLPVGAWESLVALAGGKTPVISTVPDSLVAAIPKGPVALTSNTLVLSTNSATVYLVNGVTNKIALSNFAFANEAGITGYSFTTQARLDAYPTSTTLLGFGLTCGTTDYVSAGGSVHKLDPSLKALYPFTFVPLDSYTCQLLKVGAPATKFIRTADGSIYWLDGGKKRPISSMQRFQELSQGATYLNVHALFGSAIPTGPAA